MSGTYRKGLGVGNFRGKAGMKQEERDSEAEKRLHGAIRNWFQVFSRLGWGEATMKACEYKYIVVRFFDRRFWGDDVDQ